MFCSVFVRHDATSIDSAAVGARRGAATRTRLLAFGVACHCDDVALHLSDARPHATRNAAKHRTVCRMAATLPYV
jgi:hypothetical protein